LRHTSGSFLLFFLPRLRSVTIVFWYERLGFPYQPCGGTHVRPGPYRTHALQPLKTGNLKRLLLSRARTAHMPKAKPQPASVSTVSPEQGAAAGNTVEALEKALRHQTLQCQATSQALEGFAYSVSHDLRAPLRSVTGFSDALLNEFGPALAPRAKEYMDRICKSADRMNQMLDQLLRFSRTGRSDPMLQPVDLTKIAISVSAILQAQAPKREVTWSIQPALTVRSDEQWVRIVLENLLQNAWKFTGRRTQSRIEFGFQDGKDPAYFVRDDGVGYDPAYAAKLFFPFQRLHPPDDFPGEGMGLAIAGRLIGRLGGRIWAASQPNCGATFFFTLQP
jgi:light-regulated signal transduction histidine kinase (bacteriophytochrome)